MSGDRALRASTAVLAVAVVAIMLTAAVAPQLIARGDPLAGDLGSRLLPPSALHLFGTDELGRDLFTRIVHATSTSLSVAGIAVLIGAAIGCALGLIGALAGRWADEAVMRGIDVLLAIPTLLLALGLIAVLGTGPQNVAIAVGLASSALFARIVRSDTFRVLQRGFVVQAVVAGRSRPAVVLRHVLPNVLPPIIALTVLQFSEAVLAVASLSFLGYGSKPPYPEWGALVASGRDYLTSAPWLTTIPGLTIMAASLGFHLLSRALKRWTA